MKLISILLLFSLWIPCNVSLVKDQPKSNISENYTWQIRKTELSPSVNSDWNNKIWKKTRSIRLENFMGEKPDHFPETRVKLLYDKDFVYVIFHVKDQFVKAIAKERNGQVWMDSCVEFFFSPGPDTERGYFNFEANCKGVFLFEYHRNNGDIKGFVSPEDCEKVKISHSLKADVEQEIQDPQEWSVEYRIPFAVLKNYIKTEEPRPGVTWRANFYKCADKTSHPHWLTWAPVDFPRPKFHLPEFFRKLVFE